MRKSNLLPYTDTLHALHQETVACDAPLSSHLPIYCTPTCLFGQASFFRQNPCSHSNRQMTVGKVIFAMTLNAPPPTHTQAYTPTVHGRWMHFLAGHSMNSANCSPHLLLIFFSVKTFITPLHILFYCRCLYYSPLASSFSFVTSTLISLFLRPCFHIYTRQLNASIALRSLFTK